MLSHCKDMIGHISFADNVIPQLIQMKRVIDEWCQLNPWIHLLLFYDSHRFFEIHSFVVNVPEIVQLLQTSSVIPLINIVQFSTAFWKIWDTFNDRSLFLRLFISFNKNKPVAQNWRKAPNSCRGFYDEHHWLQKRKDIQILWNHSILTEKCGPVHRH